MKKLLSIFLTISMVLLLFAGCGEEEEKKVEFKQGETATYENVDYTVTKVKRSKGNDWDKPAKGKEFVVITVKIENKSEDSIAYNTLDWKIQNGEGQIDDGAFSTIDNDTSLGSGDLAAGGKKEGTLVFEVPKGDKDLKLQYFSNVLFDEEYTFYFVLNK